MDGNVRLGPEGYLLEPEAWTEGVARALAAEEGIELTEDHWEIIRFVRRWYEDRGLAPSPRDVGIYLKKRGLTRAHMHRLFPYGYVQQVCRIAGMLRPRSWSTG